jgi:hypothetical protein
MAVHVLSAVEQDGLAWRLTCGKLLRLARTPNADPPRPGKGGSVHNALNSNGDLYRKGSRKGLRTCLGTKQSSPTSD